MKNKKFEEQFLRALTEKVMRDEAAETAQTEASTAEAFHEKAESSASALHVLDRRMQRRFRRSRVLAAAGKVGKAATMIAIALLISGMLLLSFSSTARAAFERWTHDIYENRIRYIFHGKPEEEYRLPLYEADWLPDGVELVEKIEGTFGELYGYIYMNEDESTVILFDVNVVEEGSLFELIQMEGYEHETIYFEGKTIEDYYLGENDHTAFWFEDDGRALVSVDCTLTRDELLNFIKNLRRIN